MKQLLCVAITLDRLMDFFTITYIVLIALPIVRSLWNNGVGVVCMYIFMHVCMHASMYVYLCICMYYACMYLCMYACIIHTYMMHVCTQ